MNYPYPIPGTTSAAPVVTGPYFQVGNECCGGGMTNDVDATTKVTFDYTNQLPAGVNVSSITYTVTPPADEMLVISNKTTGNTPTFMVSGGTANSYWTIEALATLSDGQKWVDHITVSVTDCGDAVSSVNLLSGLGPIIIANTLYYNATAGQTVFNLSSPDKFSRVGTLVNSNVLVYGAGDRQVPVDNYTVSAARNTVTFLSPLAFGESVVFDIVTAPPPPIPPVIVASGVVSFTLYYIATAGQEVFYLGTPDKFGNVAAATDNGVHVYRNGNLLVPGDSFTLEVSANRVTLANPAGVGESIIIDLLSVNSSASVFNGRLVFDSVAAIEEVAISPSINNIMSLSYRRSGDNGGASYTRVEASAIPIGGVQSLDGAYWKYVADGPVRLEQFGGSANGTTDNYAAFNIAIQMASIQSVIGGTPSTVYICGPEIQLLPGTYYFSQTLDLKKIIKIRGAGAVHANQICATTMLFAPSMCGVIINRYNTLGQTGQTTSTTAADGCMFEGLQILSQGGSGRGNHGFLAYARFVCRDVYVANFPGDGFHLTSTVGGAHPVEGGVNSWLMDHCITGGCSGHGLYVQGGDANAGTAIAFECLDAGCCGICDNSFLGNSYLGTEIDGYGLFHGPSGVGSVSHGGNAYMLISSQPGDGASTTPGTNSNIWYLRGTAAGEPAWSSSGTYEPGCAVLVEGASTASTFYGVYVEGGLTTPTSHLAGGAIVWGAGGVWTSNSSAVHSEVGQGDFVNYPNGVGSYTSNGVATIVGGTASVGQILKFYQTTDSNAWYFHFNGPDLELVYGGANFPLTITGEHTTYKFGTSVSQPYIPILNKIGMNGYPSPIIISAFYQPPTTGEAGLGWIVYNSAPTPGGNAGWICTTAGTNGSTAVWKSFGAISP